MSSLTTLSIPVNQFNGSLPSNVFLTLPNIQHFVIGGNQFSGPIPNSLANASFLQILDIDDNRFVGKVPNLGKLQDLENISLERNFLGSNSTNDLEFLISLTNCTKLQRVVIGFNNFGGSLPNSLGNLSTSQLTILRLGFNQISGKIPSSLGDLNSLVSLDLYHNYFHGVVPTTFEKFQKMQYLDLSENKLSGDIPPFIGNLSKLFELDLAQNMLQGTIPLSIGNCKMLQYLNLSQNNLRGTIPSEVFSLTSTIWLDLSKNSLSGSLPEEVGRLKNVDVIDLSENQLMGDIPKTIGECESLEYLYLEGNSFQGIIPSTLASVKGLRHLNLSRNNLSGPILGDLQNISVLEYLNISFNMLEGKVPTEGVFQNITELSVTGNIRLCGGISKLHLPSCPVEGTKPSKHHKYWLIGVIIGVIAFVFLLSFISTIYWMRKRNKKPSSDSSTIDQLPKVSYKDLHHGTNGFSSENMIGSGSVGFVYRGTLASDDRVVAIKVLNLEKKGAHKSFNAECNALKNIRHLNLVRILTCCSSIDYKGQEFKALVFEYMTNGSLEQWIHPRIMNIDDHPRTLDLNQRLNIIIGVASALHYLHFECEQQIVHCDLKPSNVLLDDEMVAHVSDFGMARLVSIICGSISHKHSSTLGIKGTVGYAPPEYGMGSEVSIHGDMYSFGILTLEMLTGRRPTDEMFEDGQNLHNFVKTSLPHNLLNILDPFLIPRNEATIEEEEENRGNLDPNVEKCLVSLLRIGLACSVDSPTERMNAIDVTRELNTIKRAFAIKGVTIVMN